LELAKERLERVDVVGFREDFGAFLDEVRTRYDWSIGRPPDRHVAAGELRVSDDFRRRIERDNPADIAFFEHARARFSAGTGP
jgi:hypothetical protein